MNPPGSYFRPFGAFGSHWLLCLSAPAERQFPLRQYAEMVCSDASCIRISSDFSTKEAYYAKYVYGPEENVLKYQKTNTHIYLSKLTL